MATVNHEQLWHQTEFAVNQDKLCALVGGFGSGKSQGAVYRAIHKLQTREKALYVLIAPTNSLLDDVNIPDFEEMFNELDIRYEYQRQKKKFIVHEPGLEGEIWFRSADRPHKIVGFDATDINIDEFDILKPEKQRELYIKCLGRLRGSDNTTLTFTTTPEGFRETYRLFEKEKVGPLIRARTTDNIFLPEDFIESLYQQYDTMLVKQYINAQFVNINGLMAYYAFSRDKSNLAMEKKEIKRYPHYGVGLDFNVSKMCANIFVHDPARKKIHFFDEYTLKNGNTYKMADELKERYPDTPLYIYPDATGRKRGTNATESDIAILKKKGFRVYAKDSNPFVRDRLNATNAKLSDGTVTIDVNRCPELAEDLEKVVRDKHGDIDKSDETATHSSDAFSYPIAYLYPVKSRKATQSRRYA